MKKYQWLCSFFIMAFFSHASAYVKPEIRGSRAVSLGSGYKTVTGVFLGEKVRGTEGFHGASMSEWKFKTNMGSAEKSNLINGNAEISISYGIFTASGGLDIDYINKKTNHSFSQTMYFDVIGKNVQLDRCEIPNHLRSSMRTAHAEAIFGDCFVDSLTLGGRLILDITVAYGQEIDSVEVNGNVELEVLKFIKGSASASVKIENILNNSEITVRAKQIGGDTTQLSNMFQGGSSLISCSAGNYSRCSEVVQNVIQYGERFGRQLLGLRYDPKIHLDQRSLLLLRSLMNPKALMYFQAETQ